MDEVWPAGPRNLLLLQAKLRAVAMTMAFFDGVIAVFVPVGTRISTITDPARYLR
jgi:hypothetical protein